MSKKIKYIFYFMLMFCMLGLFPQQKVEAVEFDTSGLYGDNFEFGGGDMYKENGDMHFNYDETEENNFWNTIYDKYKESIVIFSGFVALIFVILFIVNITKFAAAAANPQTRKQSIQTILWTGIAAAIFGGVALIVGLSSSLFK